MSLTSISIILTVIVLQFHYTGSYAPEISDGFYNFFTKYIAKMIGMLNKVQIYESKQLLISKKSEPISQLETSLTECNNNVNTIKKDLVLLSSDQVHSSDKLYAKNYDKTYAFCILRKGRRFSMLYIFFFIKNGKLFTRK